MRTPDPRTRWALERDPAPPRGRLGSVFRIQQSVALLVQSGCHLVFPLETPPPPPPPGLVAHYSMDDLVDHRAHDVIGNHDAECAGTACPTLVEGIRDGALHFDGDDFFLVDATPFVLPESFTIAAWIRTEAFDGFFACVMSVPFGGASDLDDWAVFAFDNGTSQSVSFDTAHTDPGNMDRLMIEGTLIPGQWHHVATRWDHEAMTKTILVDGVPAKVEMRPEPRVVTADTTALIGADKNTMTIDAFFAGDLDDLQIFSRALDDLELIELARDPSLAQRAIR